MVSTATLALLTGLTMPAMASSAEPSPVPTSGSFEDTVLQPGPPEPDEDVTEVPVDEIVEEPLPVDPIPTGKPPTDRPDAEHCGPTKNVYRPTANNGRKIKGVGAEQANYNGTSRTAKSKFIAEAGGEVGYAISGELKVSASAMVAEIEAKYGVELSLKLNAKIGNWIEVHTPPKKTTYGQFGVWRMKNTGTSYTIYSNCTTSPKKTVTSHTPMNVGWHLWER